MEASDMCSSYTSLSKLGNANNCGYEDDCSDPIWDLPETQEARPVASNTMNQNRSYQFLLEDDGSLEADYESSKEHCVSTKCNTPEVNLKNILNGIYAILTGWKRTSTSSDAHSYHGSNVSFLGFEKNGDTHLNSSVYIPSAPPLFVPGGISYTAYKEVLEADPPEWLSDSYATACMQCMIPFTAISRGRHHCRFCGGIFCRACSKGRCLLPVKFRERNPQRVCDSCYDRLDPLQGILINSISNAVQVAKHDVMDWTCTRGWLNLPFGLSMEHEIYKSSNTLRSYCQVSRLNPEKSIPLAVLKGAKGLAILTVAKAGVLVTYKIGTGLVVARRSDGSWSAPSAILSIGLGWGVQIGGELMDLIMVLHDSRAVKMFCSRTHFSIGGGCSAAVGPVGRVVEAGVRAGEKGSGMCYTYSCTKGAFVGVSLEGDIVGTRMDTNLRFYGDPYLTPADILQGTVGPPKAADPLYGALDYLYAKLGC